MSRVSSQRKGSYILIIHVESNQRFMAGSLGSQILQQGYYTYSGSALGRGAVNIPGRILRHLNPRKNLFWHIDYLLKTENSRVVSVILVQSNRKLECKLNHLIRTTMDTQVPIPGFGASDCQAHCESHLFYLPHTEERNSIVESIIRNIGLVYSHLPVKAVHI